MQSLQKLPAGDRLKSLCWFSKLVPSSTATLNTDQASVTSTRRHHRSSSGQPLRNVSSITSRFLWRAPPTPQSELTTQSAVPPLRSYCRYVPDSMYSSDSQELQLSGIFATSAKHTVKPEFYPARFRGHRSGGSLDPGISRSTARDRSRADVALWRACRER